MPFLITLLVVIAGISIYSSLKNSKQRQAIIERRKNFVASFSPNAHIIVNNGDYLFFMDDTKQVFGVDDSGTTYSYSGLHSIAIYSDAININHDRASYQGLQIGKSAFPDDKSAPLDGNSISSIASATFPILRNNLHKKLSACGITPTHEYVNRGEIWGCDINSKVYYNTHAYFQIHDFSKLRKVSMQDVSGNSNWKCNYIITVVTKGDDGWDDDELDIYVDDSTTLNNLLALFKGIKDRQNTYSIIDGQNTYSMVDGQKEFDMMEGHEFEHFCAELLKKNGYESINVTQGSGDQGIDIIAYRDGIKYGIQCKCYSSAIGNKAVQEVFAGKSFYECHVGVVLTNQYFTKSAIELAHKNGIILWDRNKLTDLIEKA